MRVGEVVNALILAEAEKNDTPALAFRVACLKVLLETTRITVMISTTDDKAMIAYGLGHIIGSIDALKYMDQGLDYVIPDGTNDVKGAEMRAKALADYIKATMFENL